MTERPSWGAMAERALAGEAITPDEARAVLAAPAHSTSSGAA